MGLTRRILESARSGISSGISQLTSLVIVDDEELSAVDPAALEAEVKARRAAREARPRKPEDNPVARMAGAGAQARAQRVKLAGERGAKIKQERQAREARDRAAADEAFRRMKQQAASGGPRPGASSGGRPGRSSAADGQVVEWYRVLDLSPGADLASIKSAYRKLMRKYHPDLHTSDPRKQKAATELSMRVTNAYNGLRQHLGDK